MPWSRRAARSPQALGLFPIATSRTGSTFVRTFEAAAIYFACVFGAGLVLGMIRVPFLVPRLGVRTAELLEMPVMLFVIVLAAKQIVEGFHLHRSPAIRLAVGCIALGLLVAAELSVAVSLGQQSVSEYVAGRDPVSGTIYLAVLGLFALMPTMVERNAKDRP